MGIDVTAILGLNTLAMKTLMYLLDGVNASWFIISTLTGSP